MADLFPAGRIEQRIWQIRGHKVMFDVHLAELYGVEVRSLIQAVKRNRERFPNDFLFKLKKQEVTILKSQSVISSSWGGRRSIPYAFTKQGVAMLSSVLHSPRAIQVNIEIMRAFVKLRQLLISHKDLAEKLDTMEKAYDHKFSVVFDALRQLMAPPPVPPKKRIGFL